MLELWAAVSAKGRIATGRVDPERPFVCQHGTKRLTVYFRVDNPPASYAVVQVVDGREVSEPRRMYFDLNNPIDGFVVRISRRELSVDKAREGFARPIDGSRDL